MTAPMDLMAMQGATHRYPAEVRWGSDYADGWRYIVAADDDDAHLQALRRGASITKENIQRRNGGAWEFIK